MVDLNGHEAGNGGTQPRKAYSPSGSPLLGETPDFASCILRSWCHPKTRNTIQAVAVNWRKTVATALFALVLASPSLSQQGAQSVASDDVAANAFARAMQAEAARHLKRIYKTRVQDLCATEARRWGDGIVVYDRITFRDDEELASKMKTTVRQWKTTGSQHPAFNASEIPKLSRYAVANCGLVGGQTKVVVAVYRSAWDTYWDNWANLLGK
jgi:hypothetical protein